MDSFNKILSFILGLVVVAVILVIIASKLNLGKKLTFLPLSDKKNSPALPVKIAPRAPTPTSVMPQPTIQPTKGQTRPTPTTIKPVGKTREIPKTGPGLMLPLATSILAFGIYLRKR